MFSYFPVRLELQPRERRISQTHKKIQITTQVSLVFLIYYIFVNELVELFIFKFIKRFSVINKPE